jgi:hypothetical protein
MMAEYKVLADVLNVRSGPSLESEKTGSLTRDTVVTSSDVQKDADGRTWIQHDSGWSASHSGSDTYMEKTSEDEPLNQPAQSQSIDETAASPDQASDDSSINLEQIKTIYQNYSQLSEFKLTSLRSIYGLPSQFLWTADMRPEGSNYGRMFTENVLMDMPICYIIPGGPRFLTGKGVDANTRGSLIKVIESAAKQSIESLETTLMQILDGKVAKYYTFQTQYTEWLKIVNALNRTSAIYLGIKDKGLPGKDSYQWLNWSTEQVESDNGSGVLNWTKNSGVLSLYYNKQSSGMSESGSNSTTKSMLDGILNKASGASREASFLMGVGAGRQLDSMNPENYETQIMNTTQMMMENFNDKDNPNIGMMKGIMNNLNVGFKTVITGANMSLPEIWSDSTFNRSFTIDIHLHSPYGDPEAFFLNIMVPLNMLIALSFPRQLGPNGYYSPFLIQANAKGVFNCDMGIVDYISINRFGSGDSMSRNGLPLEVQVSLTIRSLYNNLSVNDSNNYALFVNNIGLLDFLANFAAINLNEPDASRKLNLFISSKLNKFLDIVPNVIGTIEDRLVQAVRNTFKY